MIISSFKPTARPWGSKIIQGLACRWPFACGQECAAAALETTSSNETIMGVQEDPVPNVTEAVEATVEPELRDSNGKKKFPQLTTKSEFEHWQGVAFRAFNRARDEALSSPRKGTPMPRWSIAATQEYATDEVACWVCDKQSKAKGQVLYRPAQFFDHLISNGHMENFAEFFLTLDFNSF